VLVDVLQRAGLQPDAKRTREGIRVTVPEEQADQAHQILVANMDVIAQAARAPRERGARNRRKERPGTGRSDAPSRGERPLASERLLRLSRPLGVLLVGLLLAVIIRPLSLPLIVFSVAAAIWLLGKQTQRDGGDEDPRGRP
jgi:hypothetical protein